MYLKKATLSLSLYQNDCMSGNHCHFILLTFFFGGGGGGRGVLIIVMSSFFLLGGVRRHFPTSGGKGHQTLTITQYHKSNFCAQLNPLKKEKRNG